MSAFITSKRVQRTAKLTDRLYFLIIWNTQSWWCVLRVTGYCTITVKYVKWLRVPSCYESTEVMCHLKEGTHNTKCVQRTAKWTDRRYFPLICSTQSCWCILRVTGHFTVTVKIQSMIQSTSWYESTEALCHFKERINYIKACATYSQINWQMTYADNLQNIILMMFFLELLVISQKFNHDINIVKQFKVGTTLGQIDR